jgi:hypothetical protein
MPLLLVLGSSMPVSVTNADKDGDGAALEAHHPRFTAVLFRQWGATV